MEEELRYEALHRMSTVGRVLGNANHKLHAGVTRLRQSGLGNVSNADVAGKMGVSENICLISIFVGSCHVE